MTRSHLFSPSLALLVPQRDYGRFLSLLLVLLLVSIDSPAVAQTTYRIAGTAVSDTDGSPVQRAKVEILTTTDSKSIQTTTADESGQFSFNAVPQGAYSLRGEAPGFLPSTYQQHGAFSSAIITGSTVSTESLTLRLHQLGSLAGTITDENAEPVRQATVYIFRRDNATGDQRLNSAATLTTDDLGRYRAPRLPRGTYFVAVTARPWYAVYPGFANQQAGSIGVVPYQDPALDMAYPVTYFPTGSDSARASAIEINGNQARADIQLTPTPAVTLTFPREPGQQPLPTAQIQASIFGHPEFVATEYQSGPDGSTVTSLAPGDYILHPNLRVPSEGRGMSFETGASTPIHVGPDGPVTPHVKQASLAHVHVSVRSADGGPLPNLQVGLLPADPTNALLSHPSGPAHQADLQAEPGDYYFTLYGARGVRVREVTLAGKPLPSNDLHLAPNDNLTCTVTVAQGTHTLRGLVQHQGHPVSGAMLLLIPADQNLTLRTWFLQQSDLDGSFDLQFLPPGPYLLLALDDAAWTADWRSSAFLSRHLPHATPVLIKDASPNPLLLHDPLPLEPL
jgi:hypothetical protein